MAKESVRHVTTSGEMKMIPKTLEKEWRRWLEHPQDWCVSRQLVWGHRIPAYRVVGHEDTFVVGRNLEEATRRARERLDLSENEEVSLEQDEDVLDTWFSSGLLPLSANGWPHRLDNDSYPLDLMETGSDILFFWVARMSMLCTFLDDEHRAPFRNVYCHSLVRDKYGRKMSKSLGNVILPEYVIDGRELQDLLQDLKSGNLSDKELKRSLRETKKEFPKGIQACGTWCSSTFSCFHQNFNCITHLYQKKLNRTRNAQILRTLNSRFAFEHRYGCTSSCSLASG